MTPFQLRKCLELLTGPPMSQRRLAEELGCSERLVRRWIADEVLIPAKVAAWLEARVAARKQQLRAFPDPPPPQPGSWYLQPGRPKNE